jgi:hypothetical protein
MWFLTAQGKNFLISRDISGKMDICGIGYTFGNKQADVEH